MSPSGRRAAPPASRARSRRSIPPRSTSSIDEGVAIVDVRGTEEFATGHLPGAKHVPRGYLESRIEGVVPDRSTQVILYCASGNRSAYAARTLQRGPGLRARRAR